MSGKDQITAGDFQKFISGFSSFNPELVICNLDNKTNINMELSIEKVEVMFLLKKTKNKRLIGTIFTDSIYTPVKKM